MLTHPHAENQSSIPMASAGFREISDVRVTLPGGQAPSAPLRAVERLGIARFVSGRDHLMEVSFDGAQQGKIADFRPELPLVFHW